MINHGQQFLVWATDEIPIALAHIDVDESLVHRYDWRALNFFLD